MWPRQDNAGETGKGCMGKGYIGKGGKGVYGKGVYGEGVYGEGVYGEGVYGKGVGKGCEGVCVPVVMGVKVCLRAIDRLKFISAILSDAAL